MALVVAGLLNKQVGGKLGISVITVKAHRGSSLAGLVNMAARLRLAPAPPQKQSAVRGREARSPDAVT